MPTVTVQISAQNDDGFYLSQLGTVSSWENDPQGTLGYPLSQGDYDTSPGVDEEEYQIGLRFLSIAVPQGATITSATITMTAAGTSRGTGPYGDIYGVDVDNAPSFALPYPSSLTTASTTLTSANAASFDVTDQVQEIVNRAGWSSGNNMAFVGDLSGATNNFFDYIDYGVTPGDAGEIEIVYEVGATYTLTADAGSVAITGTAANLERHSRVSADAGAVTVTGTAAVLFVERPFAAESGAFAITGTDVAFLRTYALAADPGDITVSGTAVGLLFDRVLTAEAGSFAITGTDATFLRSYPLSVEAGSFAITGTDADLLVDRVLDASGGSVAITGTDVNLVLSGATVLDAESGAFLIGEGNVTFLRDYVLAVEPGSVTVTGTDASLDVIIPGEEEQQQGGGGGRRRRLRPRRAARRIETIYDRLKEIEEEIEAKRRPEQIEEVRREAVKAAVDAGEGIEEILRADTFEELATSIRSIGSEIRAEAARIEEQRAEAKRMEEWRRRAAILLLAA